MSSRDFLVELGTEELPPKSLPALSLAFEEAVVAGVAALGLAHGRVQRYATPRRLAVLVRRLAERQPDQRLERRGPPVSAAFDAAGQPTRAATAFADSCGTSVARLGRRAEDKGEFLYYSGIKPGGETRALLPGVVRQALERLPIARRMRWGSGTAEFVRPVHWLVLLYGDAVVPAELLGVSSGNRTRGHRFMAPRELALATPAGYAARLERSGRVLADFERRRERILSGVSALAAGEGGAAVISEPLLDEVTSLVEWPVPLVGRFDERFLALPPEVLVATLQDHQRYFPVRGANGALLPLFVTVANIESTQPAEVRAGNERVVRPRLADAAFFWDQDRRQPLAARREGLKHVTYQRELGSYAAKSARLARLARVLAAAVGADAERCVRAAELAKCDLLTGLVGEFPALQGTMGAYYARHDGEPAEVAAAIGEQYLPRHAGDDLPQTKAGSAVALADKLDTLVSIFAIGQKPSGAKDPFGLRRAALGALRIVLEQRVDLDLPQLVADALAAVRADIEAVARSAAPSKHASGAAGDPAAVAKEVCDYVFERLRAHYLEGPDGITAEMFDAVLERHPASPLDFDARLRALLAFLKLPDAAALASANKRIANILRKAGASGASALHAAELREPEEQALAAALATLRPGVEARLARRDYTAALRELAGLRPRVDAFFDKVMVMADDLALRNNRLALLASLRELFLRVADLSRLPG